MDSLNITLLTCAVTAQCKGLMVKTVDKSNMLNMNVFQLITSEFYNCETFPPCKIYNTWQLNEQSFRPFSGFCPRSQQHDSNGFDNIGKTIITQIANFLPNLSKFCTIKHLHHIWLLCSCGIRLMNYITGAGCIYCIWEIPMGKTFCVLSGKWLFCGKTFVIALF